MKQILSQMIEEINNCLDTILPKPEGRLAHIYESMRYSMFAGGKRIRPILLLMAYEATKGEEDIDVLPFACAVEMIHTYSLIHDDLPAMDDDDFRRGKPTNHIKFGEWTAILAGDALLNFAFETMIKETVKNPTLACVKAMDILGTASGTNGMVGGQVVDIMSEGKKVDNETVDFVYRNKTAALMIAPVDMGTALAGADEKFQTALHNFALNIGIAFQIADDILDITSTEEELGKPINSDIKNEKSTYVSIHGLEKAKEEVERLTQEAIKELDILGEKGEGLRKLALFLTSRES